MDLKIGAGQDESDKVVKTKGGGRPNRFLTFRLQTNSRTRGIRVRPFLRRLNDTLPCTGLPDRTFHSEQLASAGGRPALMEYAVARTRSVPHKRAARSPRAATSSWRSVVTSTTSNTLTIAGLPASSARATQLAAVSTLTRTARGMRPIRCSMKCTTTRWTSERCEWELIYFESKSSPDQLRQGR